MESATDCFICRKHAGEQAAPPGGYLYADEHFRVCHAPAEMAVPGTLLIESRRHILDFTEMTPAEAASYGALLSRIYPAIKRVVGAERVYTLVTLEGARHFHSWHIPRMPDAGLRGTQLLAAQQSCAPDEAIATAEAVRAELSTAISLDGEQIHG
jgi:diadenosine tetraphosphate (Ap4A) HIT family hydrolase